MQDLSCNLTAPDLHRRPILEHIDVRARLSNGRRGVIRTTASRSLRGNVAVDPDLKNIIYRLMSTSDADVPTLAELVTECETNVAEGNAADYQYLVSRHGNSQEDFETDEYIRNVIQQVILDGDDQVRPGEDTLTSTGGLMV